MKRSTTDIPKAVAVFATSSPERSISPREYEVTDPPYGPSFHNPEPPPYPFNNLDRKPRPYHYCPPSVESDEEEEEDEDENFITTPSLALPPNVEIHTNPPTTQPIPPSDTNTLINRLQSSILKGPRELKSSDFEDGKVNKNGPKTPQQKVVHFRSRSGLAKRRVSRPIYVYSDLKFI